MYASLKTVAVYKKLYFAFFWSPNKKDVMELMAALPPASFLLVEMYSRNSVCGGQVILLGWEKGNKMALYHLGIVGCG